MKIDAVIVCVDYGDFLAETLPHNLPHFDRVTVVTAHHDKETQELCRRLSVDFKSTDAFYRDGEVFNKAAAIQFGAAFSRHGEWLVQLDADVYLPPMTRRWLGWSHLEKDCIYGIDRVNCVGFDAWRGFLTTPPDLQHDYLCRVRAPEFPLSPRIAIRDHGGYLPIGYFQMWHASTGRQYPLGKGDCERTDVLHAMQWDKGKRRLIPEVVGVHLESAPSALGANWSGRTTPRFGPAPDAHAPPPQCYKAT